MSAYPCKWKHCVKQEEGKIPDIDFLSETFFACQFIYSCTFAVHFECYGGEKITLSNKADRNFEVDNATKEEDSSESEDEIHVASYIDDLYKPEPKDETIVFN